VVLLGVLLAGRVLLPLPAAAQEATSSPSPRIGGGGWGAGAAARDEAIVDFPDGVDFALDATAPFPVERIELLYRPAGDETLRLALPALPPTPSPTVAITHRVDLSDGELPPGIDLLYRWRLIGTGGEEVETAAASVPWLDDRFEWRTFAGERATVYGYDGDDAFLRTILERTEREIARQEDAYGGRLPAPARVWVYASMADLVGALQPNSETWVAGAAYPRFGLILAVIGPGDAAEIGRVIPHEVSHLVLHHVTGNPFSSPPTWLDEGLAVSQEEGSVEPYLSLVRQAEFDGELDGLAALDGAFPFDPTAAQLAYAQSLSLVEYIEDRYGADGLARLIAAYRQPVTTDKAIRGALGIPPAELEAGWRQALADGTGPFDGIGRRGDRGGFGVEDAWLLASGGLVMGLVALFALGVGLAALRRSRRGGFEEEEVLATRP